MSLLSFSDVVVAATLILNAVALLNYKSRADLRHEAESTFHGRLAVLLRKVRSLAFFVALWNVGVILAMATL